MQAFTCTEETLKITHIDTGDVIQLITGDTVDLPDMMVADMCSLGWGTSPAYDTAERAVGQKALTPENTSALYRKPPLPKDKPSGYPAHSARTQEKVIDIPQAEKPLAGQ